MNRNDLLDAIARGSVTLDERLDAPASGDEPSERAMDRWCRAYASGDRALWERRLSWDGLSVELTGRILGGVAVATGATLPRWTRHLDAALDRLPEVRTEYASSGHVREERLFVPHARPPFLEIASPFVRSARATLDSTLGTSSTLVSEKAFEDLERQLLTYLIAFMELALYSRFDPFRRASLSSIGSDSDGLYRAFADGCLAGDLESLLLESPGLARSIGLLIETWITGSTELLTRFQTDIPRLVEVFRWRETPSSIDRIALGLSDRHDGGRQVAVLTLDTGARVVYKPRHSGLMAQWQLLLDWLRERGLEDGPPSIRLLERPDYAWIEYVEQVPARNRKAAERYFRRAGSLVCLSYLFRGRDLHMENVIASRQGPVLVDVEAMMQPVAMLSPSDGAMQAAQDRVHRSLLDSGLLTFPETGPDGAVHDAGGLRGGGGHISTGSRRNWKGVGTDLMAFRFEGVVAAPLANVLHLDGTAQMPERYAREIAEGFETTYRFLIDHREELLDPSGPVVAFTGARTRLVFRSSELYGFVLNRMTFPEYQRDGLAPSFLADSLNRIFHSDKERPILWPLVADERRALTGLDIPMFFMNVEATTVQNSRGEPIVGHYGQSGLDAVIERLHDFGDRDLNEQMELLWGSLLKEESAIELASVADGDEPARESAERTRGELIDRAALIAREISEHAVLGRDGAATWMAPAWLRIDESADPARGYYLYEGGAGTALFLAAMARVSGDSGAASLALAALRPVGFLLDEDASARFLSQAPIGICHGLGSLVYALTASAQMLGEESLVDIAARVASLMTEERIAADERLDIEGGAAGAILAFLALHDARPEPKWIERAIACGRHLQIRSVAGPGGGRGWPDPEGVLLAGMAHGVAGMAMALMRLAEKSGEESFATLARDAWEYERMLYSPEKSNWPLVSRERPPVWMKAWCHGSPGIGLARIATHDLIADEAVLTEIENAVGSNLASGLAPIDHLCCGNAGRIDALLEMARVLGRDDLSRAARARLSAMLTRADSAGYFSLRLAPGENRSFQPGLFRGLAGVGYTILRAADTDAVPCLLTFQVRNIAPRQSTR